MLDFQPAAGVNTTSVGHAGELLAAAMLTLAGGSATPSNGKVYDLLFEPGPGLPCAGRILKVQVKTVTNPRFIKRNGKRTQRLSSTYEFGLRHAPTTSSSRRIKQTYEQHEVDLFVLVGLRHGEIAFLANDNSRQAISLSVSTNDKRGLRFTEFSLEDALAAIAS